MPTPDDAVVGPGPAGTEPAPVLTHRATAVLLVSTKKVSPPRPVVWGEPSCLPQDLTVSLTYSERPRWIGLELSQSGQRIHVDP